MNTAVVSQPTTRWSSTRRFVVPVVAERIIVSVLAIGIAGAGIGLAFVPGLSLFIGVPIAAIGCLLGGLLVRASERTIASTLVGIEIDKAGVTLVHWNGVRVNLARDQLLGSDVGQWRSPSRPNIPVAATTLTIRWRDAERESTYQLMGPWRPTLEATRAELARHIPAAT